MYQGPTFPHTAMQVTVVLVALVVYCHFISFTEELTWKLPSTLLWYIVATVALFFGSSLV